MSVSNAGGNRASAPVANSSGAGYSGADDGIAASIRSAYIENGGAITQETKKVLLGQLVRLYL